MDGVHVSNHPLVKQKLTVLRDKTTSPLQFRQLIREISMLLCYEATQDLAVSPRSVETPMGQAEGVALAESIGLVPILRAGLGMVDGIWELIPGAEVWHIGLYRDEHTMRPVHYYNRLPVEPRVQVCLILDPMLATGGSAMAATQILKDWGAKRIKYVGVIAAPEGIKVMRDTHPDVPIYVAEVDKGLNEISFIVPGLGDAGDRQFGTG